MTGNVSDLNRIREVQGDTVLVFKNSEPTKLMTFVHQVGDDKHQLRLTNRESKTHKPAWEVTQALWEAIEPAQPNSQKAKWCVEVT